MVNIQSILLIPLKVKLQALKYKPEACNFIKKRHWHRLFSREFYEIFKNIFFAEHFQKTASAGLRGPGNGSDGVHSKQVFKLARTCQNCILQKTKQVVIEGIIYLAKQLGCCTCTTQSCMAERSGCSCFSGF